MDLKDIHVYIQYVFLSNAMNCAVEGELYSDDEDQRHEDQPQDLGAPPSMVCVYVILIFPYTVHILVSLEDTVWYLTSFELHRSQQCCKTIIKKFCCRSAGGSRAASSWHSRGSE